MNNNMKTLISVIIIAVLIGLNFLLSDLVEKNPSMKLNLTSGVKLTSETVDYIKGVSKPVTFKVITTEQDSGHPIILQFNKIVTGIAALNSNITYVEVPYDTEDLSAIEKYFQISQEKGEQLTPITVIIEEGENIEFATQIGRASCRERV